jgi:hypothetical protein
MPKLLVCTLLTLGIGVGACAAPEAHTRAPAPLPVTIAAADDPLVRIVDLSARSAGDRIEVHARMSRMKQLPLMRQRALLLEIVAADGHVRHATHAAIKPLRLTRRGTQETMVSVSLDGGLAPGERLQASVAPLPDRL